MPFKNPIQKAEYDKKRYEAMKAKFLSENPDYVFKKSKNKPPAKGKGLEFINVNPKLNNMFYKKERNEPLMGTGLPYYEDTQEYQDEPTDYEEDNSYLSNRYIDTSKIMHNEINAPWWKKIQNINDEMENARLNLHQQAYAQIRAYI